MRKYWKPLCTRANREPDFLVSHTLEYDVVRGFFVGRVFSEHFFGETRTFASVSSAVKHFHRMTDEEKEEFAEHSVLVHLIRSGQCN